MTGVGPEKWQAHVRALEGGALATLVKALATDIPRMQSLLATARREVRLRKRQASSP